jgi:phosphoglycerol transferase MdoB-like AlkP superfamily enzyme
MRPSPRGAWRRSFKPFCGLLIRPLAAVGATLVLFTAARIALWVIHAGDFALVPAAEYPQLLLRGLRFDLSIILTASAAPILWMVLFPARPARSGGVWRLLGPWLAYAVFVFLLFLIAVDLVYFGHVHRHLGPEVAIVGENAADTLQFAAARYGGVLAGCVLLAASAFFLWRGLLRATPPPPAGFLARLAAGAITAGLLIGGIRGSFTGERLELIDAYPGLSPKAAILALNGPYTALTYFLQRGLAPAVFTSHAEALETLKGLAAAASETAADPDYPLLRRRPPGPGPRPNVVVILLESWSAVSVDVYRRLSGLPPLGLTPHFDALAQEGVLFTRFYDCGQRTRHALAAVLNGLPALPTLPLIGKGLEALPISYLGRLAREETYTSHYFHPETAADEKRYAGAASAGFDHFVSRDQVRREQERFWDADLYREAAERLASSRRPFLAFIMTSIPHAPYRRPPGPWDRFPDDGVQSAYYNALGYADWALGGFIQRLKELPDYERTLCIVLSDHVERIEANPSDPTRLFHIPCLVIAPGLPAGVSEAVGSQVDVIPTIAHLAGWGAAHASLGRSLFDRSDPSAYGALLRYSENMIRVEAGGWVHHSLRSRIEAQAHSPEAALEAIEQRLLATVQAATRLYLGGRLAKPE